MKKILLTSAGFENINIQNKFLELVEKDPSEIKALFVTTAAIEPDAIMVLPKCLNDFLSAGILKENITVYDMHKVMTIDELRIYDAIYFCGGSTRYLVSRMKEDGFDMVVNEYVDHGGIYIGVSAGSVCASGKYDNNLNFIPNVLNVHCDIGDKAGDITNTEPIKITNAQAILITDDECKIIE